MVTLSWVQPILHIANLLQIHMKVNNKNLETTPFQDIYNIYFIIDLTTNNQLFELLHLKSNESIIQLDFTTETWCYKMTFQCNTTKMMNQQPSILHQQSQIKRWRRDWWYHQLIQHLVWKKNPSLQIMSTFCQMKAISSSKIMKNQK